MAFDRIFLLVIGELAIELGQSISLLKIFLRVDLNRLVGRY